MALTLTIESGFTTEHQAELIPDGYKGHFGAPDSDAIRYHATGEKSFELRATGGSDVLLAAADRVAYDAANRAGYLPQDADYLEYDITVEYFDGVMITATFQRRR